MESNPYILNYPGHLMYLRVVDIRRREVIDITISTVRTVKVWHVSAFYSRYLSFDID